MVRRERTVLVSVVVLSNERRNLSLDPLLVVAAESPRLGCRTRRGHQTRRTRRRQKPKELSGIGNESRVTAPRHIRISVSAPEPKAVCYCGKERPSESDSQKRLSRIPPISSTATHSLATGSGRLVVDFVPEVELWRQRSSQSLSFRLESSVPFRLCRRRTPRGARPALSRWHWR